MHKFCLLLLLALIGSCDEEETTSDSFIFSASTYVDPSVTDVLVDGTAYQLSIEGNNRVLRFERTYADYLTAQASEQITLDFLVNGTIRRVGHLLPGVCARFCPVQFCPQGNDLLAEQIELPSDADFQPYEYVCFNCVGAANVVPSCH